MKFSYKIPDNPDNTLRDLPIGGIGIAATECAFLRLNPHSLLKFEFGEVDIIPFSKESPDLIIVILPEGSKFTLTVGKKAK